jgi:hypothetical protein
MRSGRFPHPGRCGSTLDSCRQIEVEAAPVTEASWSRDRERNEAASRTRRSSCAATMTVKVRARRPSPPARASPEGSALRAKTAPATCAAAGGSARRVKAPPATSHRARRVADEGGERRRRVGRVGGEARVDNASGDVELGEAGGSVKVRTASGDQQVRSVTQGRVDLTSASGDILVGIKQGSRVYIDARSMSGEVSSELELGDDAAGDDGPLVELQVTAMSGDVEVVRA